ncbi:MAG: M14 family zinc carboxypeptidase [Bacteroidota bacterium]
MAKQSTYILVLVLAVGAVMSGFGQAKAIENQFFPAPDTDEQFQTPAFKKSGFTKYQEMLNFLEELRDQQPEMVTLDWIGYTAKGRRIPIVHINKGEADGKVKVWYQGGVHGNEPASTEGMLHFMNLLVTDEVNHSLLDDVSLAVVPMVNIDGFIVLERQLANGKDLNRDQAKLQTQEAQVLRAAYNEFQPQVVVDFHEYNPYRADFRDMDVKGTTSFYDFMFLPSNNLNQTPPIRELSQDLFMANAESHMSNQGFNSTLYKTVAFWRGHKFFNQGGTSPRSSASAYALTNAVSILMEIRGVGLMKQNLKRRVYITKELAFNYLKTANEHADLVREKIQASLDYIQTSDDPIVVRSEPIGKESTFKMIDLNTRSAKEYPIILKERSNQRILIDRSRAEGYFIEGSYAKAIEKLKQLGLEMTLLTTSREVKCDRYLVEELVTNRSGFEGINTLEVEVALKGTQKLFAPGTYYVSSRQKNGQLLTELLEPDADNSFLRMRIVELGENMEYKIYRTSEKSDLP